MLKLNFKTFRDKIELDQVNGHFPTIHCLKEIDKYVFVIKSKEKWDYYSIVTMQDIMNFAESHDLTLIEAIMQFEINYCSNTLSLESEENMLDVISEDSNPNQSDLRINSMINPHLIKEIDAGQDIIIEAEDYSDFLLKLFDLFEKKTLAAVDKINLEKKFHKNFGEFLSNLFNGVNTIAFSKHILKFIKEDIVKGISDVENELGIDIGFTEDMLDKVMQLQQQQINGYIINGKLWPGIKGVTKEIQAKVIQTVQEGLNENKSSKEIKEDIKKVYGGFSDWRATMIARTETTRIINEGKLLGYKETGISGKKVWDSAIDARTSDICKRLNNQERELDEGFIDPKTKKAYSAPPAHVNCRSVIFFKPD